MLKFCLFAAALAAGIGLNASAAGLSFKEMNLEDYDGFVGNWKPQDAPLCAAMRSGADWDQLVIVTPGPGGDNPPAILSDAFWRDHAVVLLAQAMPSKGSNRAYQVRRVSRTGDVTEVDYRFTPPPPAGSIGKAYLVLAIPAPLSDTVVFKSDKGVTCTLKPGAGQWLVPAG